MWVQFVTKLFKSWAINKRNIVVVVAADILASNSAKSSAETKLVKKFEVFSSEHLCLWECHMAEVVVNYGISNTIVLEIP